ncbi:hypothetical protein F1188_03410 [Roseospira marina]|uniref:UrcA family protein n=1 Tax=Roseospira marina TaxID=140057 RepID=A0A5M6IFS4_9PROT|nr:hypothetical protein [Roseospira marina]KAA5606972.1 hypothetical protein F1188_03410 [Roseospira marina]MBB4312850.1 hypothetical protein [Roseospira marina]MBB5086377.1 hypothetical protein [Roseospira marina]
MALAVAGALLGVGVAPTAGAQDAAAIADLDPAELMARYQAECAGGAAPVVPEAGAARARVQGQRCDALARAIQTLSLDDRRAGSADLARPDFYTPGAR